MSKRGRHVLKSILFAILVIVIMLYILLPFLWMLLSSLKLQKDILNLDKLLLFTPTIQNYITVFSNYDFADPIWNSLVIAVISTAWSMLLGFPCAYAIARYRMHKLNVIILFVRVLPAICFLIPWYMIVSALGMADTYAAVSLSHMVISLPFCVWVMVPFCEAIPTVIEEAAMIDGCSPLRRFVSIILPLSSSGLITVLIMSFIFSWNNFMYAMILSGARTRTLPLALFNFLGYSFVDWGALMAAAVIVVFPVLFIAFATQRYIVQGLTAGAVKG